MSAKRYLAWFLSVVALSVAALMAFNTLGDAIILTARAGPSVQTISGFERVIKPAWLESLAPSLVFIGSSRMREGFDPVLIDPVFHVRSFNFGVSSITPYEARRFVQDALAQKSVRTIVMSLDAFAGGIEAQPTGAGFDELRLAVTPSGQPTARHGLWLFTTRYLSGGALGMHALGLYLLGRLGPEQTAEDRPDLFPAYGHMTAPAMQRDLVYRAARAMVMAPWQEKELRSALGALCHSEVHAILFFPPDNEALIERYEANDAAELARFKETVRADIARHNRHCEEKVELFDFLGPNALTTEKLSGGQSQSYADLVHFRPPAGLWLLRQMLPARPETSTQPPSPTQGKATDGN